MTSGYSVVSDAQREQFREEGLCILEGVIDPATVTMLREECSYFLGYIDAVMDEQGSRPSALPIAAAATSSPTATASAGACAASSSAS